MYGAPGHQLVAILNIFHPIESLHWNRYSNPDGPDNADDNGRRLFGTSGFERVNHSNVPVHGDDAEGEDADVDADHLHEGRQGAHEVGQNPSLQQRRLKLEFNRSFSVQVHVFVIWFGSVVVLYRILERVLNMIL